MGNIFKYVTIAAVGVAIGTVAGKFVKPEKLRANKISRTAPDQKDQLKATKEKGETDKDLDDLDNCFI